LRAPKLELNFLPPAILEERQRRRNFLLYSPLVILAGLLLGGIFYLPQYQAERYQRQIDQCNLKYADLARAKSYYIKSRELKANYDQSHRAVQNIQQKQVDIVEIINGISSVLPPEVYVTCLEVNSSQGVILTFETDSALRTAQFIVGLRNLPFFQEVEPVEVPLRGRVEEVKLEMPFKGVKAIQTEDSKTD